MAQDLFTQLAQQTLANISTEGPAEVGDDPVSAIIQVAQERGIDPANLLGLAKLETQAGAKTVKGGGADTRNLFNVKDFSKDGTGIRARDGAEGSNDRYRAYGSYRESVEDLAGLLERRYPGAAKADSPEAFARELKRGGYATDPAYESKLARVIRSSGGAARPSAPAQEWDQGARYAPVGVTIAGTDKPQPAEKPSKRAGFWEGAADVGLSTAQGVVGSVKALTDLAGADNAASQGLDDASKRLEKFKSDASQQDRQYHQQKIKEAEASGDWQTEVAAYANMVWDMPLESLAQGVGSFATLGAGKVAQMAKLASAAKKAGVAKEAFLKTAQGIEAAKKASDLGMKVNVSLGVGQGIGGVKGSQYEQTYNAAKESGLSERQAQTLATEAQSYQQGWGQQALGAGLGYLAGKTGPIEKLAAGKTVGAGGVARRFAGGGLVEAGTEGLQGGQERYAGNAAAIDAGVLDESRRWAGVAGSGASEAITAGVLGGGAGALGRPDVDPQAQARAAAQQSGGIASRAGLAATPGAQRPNPAVPNSAATQPTAAAASGAAGQPAATPAAGPVTPAAQAQPAQTPIQASALSAIEQALEADKQRRRTAGEVVEDEVEEVDVVASGNPAAVDPPDAAPPPAMQAQPAQPAQPASAGFSLPAFDNSPIPKMEPAQADEQRRQFAEFEQKRKNRRAGTRSAAWERNPFLAFLGANGLNRDTASEFAPGLTERRKAFVPGYGPVFRPGAKNLDELVQTAKEDGFLRDDDGEPELYDLIDRALRGERIAPLFADGAAEAEGQRRQQEMLEREGATYDDYLQQHSQAIEADDFDPLESIGASGYDFGDSDMDGYAAAPAPLQAEVAALSQHYYDLGFDPDEVLERLSIETENQPEQAYYDLAKSRFTQLIEQALSPGRREGSTEQGGGGAVRRDAGQASAAQADGSAAGGQGQAAAVTPPAAPAVAQPRRTDAIRAKLDDLKSQGFSQFTRSSGRTLLLNPDTYETVELTPAEMAVARTASGQARAGLQSLRGQRNPAQVDQQGVDVLQSYTPADVLTQEEQASQQQAADQAERDKAQAQARADDERKRIEQASYAAADSFELGQNPLDSLTGQQDIFGSAPASRSGGDVDVEETRAGLAVDATDAESLREFLGRDIDPATGRPIHSQGRRNELTAELESLEGSIATAQDFLKTSGSTAASPLAQDLAGERINDEWTAFDPQSGTLGIPRAEMPQIKAEHRGAMMGFLKARGIDGQQENIPSAAIKPTQAEFSPAKVKKAMDREGGNRSIIVSADGYVVDGHHQWLAAREQGKPIQAIRLDQNVGDVLAALKDMPSAQPEQGAKAEPVAGLFDGKPDPRNSAPLQELDGFQVGEAVDVPSRTIGRSHIEVLFKRTTAGTTMDMARIVNGEGKKLDVLTGQMVKVEDASTAWPSEIETGDSLDVDAYRARKFGSDDSHGAQYGTFYAESEDGTSGYGGSATEVVKERVKANNVLVADSKRDALEQLFGKNSDEVGRWAEASDSAEEDAERVADEMIGPEALAQGYNAIVYPNDTNLYGNPTRSIHYVGGIKQKLKTEADPYPLVTHTTTKGKTLRGFIVRGMTLDGVKASIDPYALKKDGGVFVREQHKDKLPKPAASDKPAETPEPQGGQEKQATQSNANQQGQDDSGAQWSRMTSIDREAVALRAKMPKAAAAMWSKRGWDAIDSVIQEKLEKAMRREETAIQPTSDAVEVEGMTQAEAQQALEAGQKLLHYDEEIWIDRAKTDAVDSYVIKNRYTDSPIVSTKGPAGPRGVQWGKSEAAKRAVESMGLPQERQPDSATPADDASENVKKLTELKQDLQALQQRIKEQGQVADDRLLERERKLSDVVKSLERDIQKAKLDQIPAASVPDDARNKALEAGKEMANSIFDWTGKSSGVAKVKVAVMDSLMAQGYFDDGVANLAKQIVEELRQRDAQARSQPAGRKGYDTQVELNAAQLKTILEQTRGEPLVDKPAKLEAWRNGTAKTDPAKFPIELFLTTDGRLDVNDGRHRIALAAERGEKVTAFIDGKDAKRVKDLLAATDSAGVEYVDRMLAEAQQRLDTMRANQAKAGTNAWSWDKKIAEAEQAVAAYQKVRDSMAGGKASETTQDADFQERLERANNRIPEGFEIRAEGNTVSLYRNGERTKYYGLNANDGGMSEAVRQANRLFNLPESSSQAIQDFIDGKSDAVPTLEEVQAGTLGRLEKELADWQVRRELPINQGQIGVIDEEIAKLQAQVDALRGATGQEDKQPSIAADPDLEAIFDQLDGITQRTQAAGQQAAAAHPQAERIQFVQKHILDILEDLEDSGKVTINC